MKKFTLLFILAVLTNVSFGQQTMIKSPIQAQKATAKFKNSKAGINSSNKSSTTESFWLCYGDALNTLLGGTSTLYISYLFPDSIVQADFSGTYSYINIHNIGNVLDVKNSAVFGLNWNENSTYTVDSMSILYLYERNHPDPNIVDTLIVELYSNSNDNNLSTYLFSGMAGNYGHDTVRFKGQQYDYLTNTAVVASPTDKQTFTFPLTIADTASYFFGEKVFTTNSFSIAADKLVASTVSFKPGYTYSLGDSIENLNSFNFASYEENGQNSFPSYTPGDWNVSSILPTIVRYNMDPTPGWNGLFIPTYAYTQPYGLEHHVIFYKVTSNNVGINDILSADGGVKLSQNQPNPFTTTSNIAYELAKLSKVSLELYDITGRKVATLYEGNKEAGKHVYSFDAAKFTEGLYFYTLKAGGVSLTRRMIITE